MERQLAGQQEIHDDSQTEHIYALSVLFMFVELGGHKTWSAGKLLITIDLVEVNRVDGQSKINNLGADCFPSAFYQDVVEFQVSVDQPDLMDIFQGF